MRREKDGVVNVTFEIYLTDNGFSVSLLAAAVAQGPGPVYVQPLYIGTFHWQPLKGMQQWSTASKWW